MTASLIPSLATLRAGGEPAIARALALVETAHGSEGLAGLLDEATVAPASSAPCSPRL